jgi:GT2 family glycosyltransferase
VPPAAAHVEEQVDLSSQGLSLTVIVCTYSIERWPDLQAAVASALHQSMPALEVVVVVDHNDELCELAQRKLSSARVVASTGPQGLSGARNTGMAKAHGDIVAFLDDDAVADPSWVAELTDCYRDPRIIGVGGGVAPAWRAPRPGWLPEEFLWVVGCSYRGQPTYRSPVRNAIGANMSFRRDVLQQSGGFNPTVGRFGANAAGCEETELSIRLLRQSPGSRILLEPRARVRHTVTAERVTRRYFRSRCRAEGESKAVVTGLAGSDASLSSERIYISRTLPVGALKGIGEALRGDPAGVARTLSILEGLALTCMGYVDGRAKFARSCHKRLAPAVDPQERI